MVKTLTAALAAGFALPWLALALAFSAGAGAAGWIIAPVAALGLALAVRRLVRPTP